jgi:hypothetical protein
MKVEEGRRWKKEEGGRRKKVEEGRRWKKTKVEEDEGGRSSPIGPLGDDGHPSYTDRGRMNARSA